MIKPDWSKFKAKYSENPQSAFEWFSYLLFCKENNISGGIFRYVNQAGIETNPIQVGKDHIGWEAKFYEDKLSAHTDEFIEKIETAKNKNPELVKICFYSPIDWTESSSKTKRISKTQKKVEDFAKDKGVEIIWKGASFFESPFVSIDNEIIAQHFFSLDDGVIQLVKNFRRHTQNILKQIRTSIKFNKQDITLDRATALQELKNNLDQVAILSGNAGVGKTALIKQLYEELEDSIPFYVFKANEFELPNLDSFFRGIDYEDFLRSHAEETQKIAVIDSAERLLDLKNTEPFKEFLGIFIENGWQIILTTRDNYLEDLNYQLAEIYQLIPKHIRVENLNESELKKVANDYSLELPNDSRLLELVRNPFYLNEYLLIGQPKDSSYSKFRDTLWDKLIKKSKPARAECLINMAVDRTSKGVFFTSPTEDKEILDDELLKDGIIAYDSNNGYFITHDLYEEWALEKYIQRSFTNRSSVANFFTNIGSNLPTRRAFRNWISDQLISEKKESDFINETIESEEIESFWKDELLTAIILSEYSEFFFIDNKENLLKDKFELLKKISFLLRIACKEVDNEIIGLLGEKDINLLTLKYVLTKPKGSGWSVLIKFVFDNIDKIEIENVGFILPIISDWNSKYKSGNTTKLASLIALKFYQWLMDSDHYISEDETLKKIIKTILYGAYEIKEELSSIIDQVIENNWKHHRDPYYHLSSEMLGELDSIHSASAIPKKVIELANLFWTDNPKKKDPYGGRMDIEEHFGIESNHRDYFPASSYQTPILWLLQSDLKSTVDFILEFTNRTVSAFAKSEFAKYEVQEIEVILEDGKTIKQFISNRIWCIYRGTQVAPHVLESMHMALEKFFLEKGEGTPAKVLESWLMYLLKNSKSASISALVVSIVLKYPAKTFNVAKLLFQTKEFFLFDTNRLILDQGQKSQLLSLQNSFGSISQNQIHENERIKVCDDKHRAWTLENLCLYYQFFKFEKEDDKESSEKQSILWSILDAHYKELPSEEKQTKEDKTWRLFLARMDRRKMKPETKETEEGVVLEFNPQIDKNLKTYSEEALKQSSERMKYIPIRNWSSLKSEGDLKYKEYNQYEGNIKHVIEEVKEILKGLRSKHESDFYLMNHSTPVTVCSTLLKDHFNELTQEEKTFCKDVVLEFMELSLHTNFRYPITSGFSSALSSLPTIYQHFDKGREAIKEYLLFTLFDDSPINMANTRVCDYAISTIVNHFWEIAKEDTESLVLGYLLLKDEYSKLRRDYYQTELFKRSKRTSGGYILTRENIEVDFKKLKKQFIKEHKEIYKKFITNQLSFADLNDVSKIKVGTLINSFYLFQNGTNEESHLKYIEQIIPLLVDKIFIKDYKGSDYLAKTRFLDKFAYFLLSRKPEDIAKFIEPFIRISGDWRVDLSEFFESIISGQDRLQTNESFWTVWNLLKPKLIELYEKDKSSRNLERMIKAFLFGINPWKEEAKKWDTFQNENKSFFKSISQELKGNKATLYSISKLLNGIGSHYLDDGITWLSDIVKENEELSKSPIDDNTLYYLENILRKFTFENKQKIRQTKILKDRVLILLDFMILKGSSIGYMLREYIL